jgi:hypothetical protein
MLGVMLKCGLPGTPDSSICSSFPPSNETPSSFIHRPSFALSSVRPLINFVSKLDVFISGLRLWMMTLRSSRFTFFSNPQLDIRCVSCFFLPRQSVFFFSSDAIQHPRRFDPMVFLDILSKLLQSPILVQIQVSNGGFQLLPALLREHTTTRSQYIRPRENVGA